MPAGMVGAQLYTLRDHLKTLGDVQTTLKRVARIGYTAVQVSRMGSVEAADIARAAKDSGLQIVASHVPWERFCADLDQVIAEHRLWNCRHAAVGSIPKEYWTAEGLKRFIAEVAPIAQRLNAAGIDFSYHNHNQEMTRLGSRTWLEQLYKQTNPALVKAEIDTYWIQAGGGDPAAWIARYPRRQPLLHLKDMTLAIVDGRREQRFAEIGEGNLNWPAILKAAAAAGVEYYLVEQDQCYDRDPFESLALSYRNLLAMGLR